MADSNYCPDCGQLNTTKQVSLRAFLNDFLGDYLTFDSKFFRSFIPLIGRPGYLTNEYNSGRRTSYILPLRLYLFTTVLFFFVLTATGKLSRNDVENIATPVAAQDSLAVLLAKYNGEITNRVQERLIHDIDRSYKLLARPKRKRRAQSDSLRSLLSEDRFKLAEEKTRELEEAISERFRLRRKADDVDNSHLELAILKEMLSERAHLNEAQRNMVAAAIDSSFRFTNTLYQADVTPSSDIELTFQNTDTTQSGFGKAISDRANKLAAMGDYGGAVFWREMLNQMPKVLFFVMPIFALILKLLFIREKIFYINHLIFALHAHTMVFIYFLALVFWQHPYLGWLAAVATWLHLFVGMRNVYRQSRFWTFIKLNALLFLYIFPVGAGFVLLALLAIFNI